MAYVITLPCLDIKDRTCVSVCPVECIYEGDRILYINPDECIDCAACQDACPNAAVLSEDALKLGDKPFLTAAREWVVRHSATGGSADRGVVGKDHLFIAALPASE